MRNMKLMAAALTLALTGMVYAAAQAQDAPKTQQPASAARSCCQKHDGKHEGAHSGEAHAGMKHEGCCAGDCCQDGCCAGGSCSMEHKKGHAHASMEQSADTVVVAGDADCCGGCCKDGSCSMEHHKGAKGQSAAAHTGESCCAGGSCCKAHQSDAKQTAAQKSSTGKEGACCACCNHKADHTMHASR